MKRRSAQAGDDCVRQVPASPSPHELAPEIFAFWNVLRGTGLRFQALADELGISQMGTKVLQALMDSLEEMSLKELSDQVDLELGAAGEAVDELCERGWLTRRDGVVVLTTSGREVAGDLASARFAGAVEWAAGLTEPQRASLFEGLAALRPLDPLQRRRVSAFRRRQVSSEELALEMLVFWTQIRFGGAAAFQALSESLALSMTGAKALAGLRDCGGRVSLEDLAGHIALPTASTRTCAEELSGRGWAEIDKARVGITPAGLAVLDQLDSARLAGVEEYAAGLTAEQRAQLLAALSTVPRSSRPAREVRERL